MRHQQQVLYGLVQWASPFHFANPEMIRTVLAYHGTTHSSALTIHDRSSPFRLSNKDGNWLGRGAYFFEENQVKAVEWAISQVDLQARLGSFDSPAILVADLDLTHCLDLCSSLWHDNLRAVAERLDLSGLLRQQHGPELITSGNRTTPPQTFVITDYNFAPQPQQTAADHFADKQAIDALVADLLADNVPITSVRASFAAGHQPYSNSHFFSDTHTQIAVLDPAAIVTIRKIIHPVEMPTSLRKGRQTPPPP